jgi:hypothetical protein
MITEFLRQRSPKCDSLNSCEWLHDGRCNKGFNVASGCPDWIGTSEKYEEMPYVDVKPPALGELVNVRLSGWCVGIPNR